MTDIVDRKTRSRMMSGIRSRNTRIEITVRKRLFSLGFRYRINDRRLPGKPDMVFPNTGQSFLHTDVSGTGMTANISVFPQATVTSGRQKSAATKSGMKTLLPCCMKTAGV